jgi:hypothetical protein
MPALPGLFLGKHKTGIKTTKEKPSLTWQIITPAFSKNR